MAATPDITLKFPFVLVSDTTDSKGLQNIGGVALNFCYVEMVYDTSDKTKVGDTGYFERDKALQFLYGSTIYYLVNEDNIKFKETLAP